jgi:hypothetical protein
VAHRVGTGISLLFHDHGTRRGRVVSSTPRPYFTPGKDPVPIVQEAGWAPGPVWTGAENLAPIGIFFYFTIVSSKQQQNNKQLQTCVVVTIWSHLSHFSSFYQPKLFTSPSPLDKLKTFCPVSSCVGMHSFIAVYLDSSPLTFAVLCCAAVD